MNSETYAYTLLAALIGMSTVFIGLTLLSLMMMLLRRFFKAEVPRAATSRRSPAPLRLRGTAADTRWVLAAAAVFLETESGQVHRSARRWKPTVGTPLDPWLNQPERER
jgi:Na+-transporting methylmalonyl-CoA/oxaloacetate decarboxylase gamma subunit